MRILIPDEHLERFADALIRLSDDLGSWVSTDGNVYFTHRGRILSL